MRGLSPQCYGGSSLNEACFEVDERATETTKEARRPLLESAAYAAPAQGRHLRLSRYFDSQ